MGAAVCTANNSPKFSFKKIEGVDEIIAHLQKIKKELDSYAGLDSNGKQYNGEHVEIKNLLSIYSHFQYFYRLIGIMQYTESKK